MVDTPSTVILKNGAGADTTFLAMVDGSTEYAFQTIPRILGAPVDLTNRMPTMDASLGLPADTAWSGSGSGAVIAVLKAIWTALTGTLKTSTPSYTMTDRSGTIAVGGLAQSLLATNANRRGWSIQSLSTSDIYWNTTGTATFGTGSNRLTAGSLWEGGADSDAVSLIGSANGQPFTAKEW